MKPYQQWNALLEPQFSFPLSLRQTLSMSCLLCAYWIYLSGLKGTCQPGARLLHHLTSHHASPLQPSNALHGTSVYSGITGNSVEDAHSKPPLPEKPTFRRAGLSPQTRISKTTPGGSHAGVQGLHQKTSFQSYPITYSSSHHPVMPFVAQPRLLSSHRCYLLTKFLFTLPGPHPMLPL